MLNSEFVEANLGFGSLEHYSTQEPYPGLLANFEFGTDLLNGDYELLIRISKENEISWSK